MNAVRLVSVPLPLFRVTPVRRVERLEEQFHPLPGVEREPLVSRRSRFTKVFQFELVRRDGRQVPGRAERVDDRQVLFDVLASDGDAEARRTIVLVLRVTVEVRSSGDRNRVPLIARAIALNWMSQGSLVEPANEKLWRVSVSP
jgi:hypothetical protein